MFDTLITIIFSFYVFFRINYSMIRRFIKGHLSKAKGILYLLYIVMLNIVGFYLIHFLSYSPIALTEKDHSVLLVIIMVSPLFIILNVLIAVISYKYYKQRKVFIRMDE